MDPLRATQQPQPVSLSYRNRVPKLSHTYRSQHVNYVPGPHPAPSARHQLLWSGDDELFELSEGEAANSVAVLNALVAETPQGTPSKHEMAELQATTVRDELARIDWDLDQRWRGALFALHPSNPDTSRHFCSSSREMLDYMLRQAAPDGEVFAANPHAQRTEQGLPTRRSRVVHCLHRRGSFDEFLAAFVDADIENVVTLFRQLNDGTHGHAGRFDLAELRTIKQRVEDAVRFVARITD